MVSPLEGSIAAKIGKAFASTFYACVLTRLTPGDGPPDDPGPSTPIDYPCRGMVEDFELKEIDGTLVKANDRKVMILATSLPVRPLPEDRVIIRGATYVVVKAVTDPAEAVWTLQVRA